MKASVFVERRFELDGGELVVRFHAPEKTPTGEFGCRLTMGWPDREVHRTVHGEDGVQALLLAMQLARSELRESEAYRSGTLTLFGDATFDLFGDASLEPLAPPRLETTGPQ